MNEAPFIIVGDSSHWWHENEAAGRCQLCDGDGELGDQYGKLVSCDRCNGTGRQGKLIMFWKRIGRLLKRR